MLGSCCFQSEANIIRRRSPRSPKSGLAMPYVCITCFSQIYTFPSFHHVSRLTGMFKFCLHVSRRSPRPAFDNRRDYASSERSLSTVITGTAYWSSE